MQSCFTISSTDLELIFAACRKISTENLPRQSILFQTIPSQQRWLCYRFHWIIPKESRQAVVTWTESASQVVDGSFRRPLLIPPHCSSRYLFPYGEYSGFLNKANSFPLMQQPARKQVDDSPEPTFYPLSCSRAQHLSQKMKLLVSRQVAKLYCLELDVLFIPLYINESKG